MIGHHTRLRGNNDLPFWRAPAIKKKPPFFNVRALITREFMRSKDAQCSAKGRNDLNEPCEGLVMFRCETELFMTSPSESYPE